ncbi:homocysteine S-methyltransferase family protein [Actinomyces oris]|uniref:Homocysteine S-methyltransferase family protein n=1 Tax=Actinomyces oris TaxID=544580 RepID=A0AAW9KUR3_9ACTO|nr:homocysteine S-methyltransferase family protein [Actinomyces oris]MEA1303975.1 homocysteine S-methyltransferase family protein [Actinomyces oris]
MVKGLAPQAECWWVSFQVRSDGARLADGTSLAKAAAWAAQEAIVVAVGINCVAPGVVWMYCTRVGCCWRRGGGTSGGWGLRAVRTTRGQWIPTLVE